VEANIDALGPEPCSQDPGEERLTNAREPYETGAVCVVHARILADSGE
jgi:hypothetical protein